MFFEMGKRVYNIIITEFDPSLPKIMRLLKTTSLDHAIEVADRMKNKLRNSLDAIGQTIVVVSFDRCDGSYIERLEHVTN